MHKLVLVLSPPRRDRLDGTCWKLQQGWDRIEGTIHHSHSLAEGLAYNQHELYLQIPCETMRKCDFTCPNLLLGSLQSHPNEASTQSHTGITDACELGDQAL
eukprot:TRINITY_DN66980_c1_g1_i1.p3 TRINITY_DN66980_c1_g1~~TRINITY_DN66980_c1_g1_i1.p3  ORF type:complete len:102 (-),score=0.70 TRINITY_DN66980_c1_g1_i1:1131-1436(-)